MSYYLDNSVLVPMFVVEARSGVLRKWVGECPLPLYISDLAAGEFNATMSRLVRTGGHSREQASAQVDEFERWRGDLAEPLENLPVDIRTAARLVTAPYPKLLTPDAIHLATCKRLSLTLVSDDKRLIEVAERIGIASLSPA